MSDRPRAGDAYKAAEADREARQRRYTNARANQRAQRGLVDGTDLTAEQLAAIQPRLKAEAAERRARRAA